MSTTQFQLDLVSFSVSSPFHSVSMNFVRVVDYSQSWPILKWIFSFDLPYLRMSLKSFICSECENMKKKTFAHIITESNWSCNSCSTSSRCAIAVCAKMCAIITYIIISVRKSTDIANQTLDRRRATTKQPTMRLFFCSFHAKRSNCLNKQKIELPDPFTSICVSDFGTQTERQWIIKTWKLYQCNCCAISLWDRNLNSVLTCN